jgi:hypothetical protein
MPEVVFIRADLSTFKVNLPSDLPPYWHVVSEAKNAELRAKVLGLDGKVSLRASPVPVAVDTYERQVLDVEFDDGSKYRTVTYRYMNTTQRA